MDQTRNTGNTKPTRPAAPDVELSTDRGGGSEATTFDVPDYDMFTSSFSYGDVQSGRIAGQAGGLCDDTDFVFGNSCGSTAGGMYVMTSPPKTPSSGCRGRLSLGGNTDTQCRPLVQAFSQVAQCLQDHQAKMQMEQLEVVQRLTSKIESLQSAQEKSEKEQALLAQRCEELSRREAEQSRRLGELGLHTKKLQESVVQSLTSKTIHR